MNRERIFEADNAAVLVTVGTFLLLLACLPLAMGMDERIDRDRPMYVDLSRMEALQTASVATTGAIVPLELTGGESAEVAGQEFVASEGVSVVVRDGEGDETYCISVSNQHDAEAEHCG
ncbi:hypothetical protein [Nocardioides sediminis]|uniref:hypothetical protein n=1 Tax=Nocardioides sediminis TaxID=433648 RepID=UPI00131F3EB7|nr:hypothetical protein [Nocardioides sediminis]